MAESVPAERKSQLNSDLKALLLQNTFDILSFIKRMESSMDLPNVTTPEHVSAIKEQCQIVIQIAKHLETPRAKSGKLSPINPNPTNNNNSLSSQDNNDQKKPNDPNISSEAANKIFLFRTKMMNSITEIRDKIDAIQEEARTTKSLPQLIKWARYIRDIKKLLEKYDGITDDLLYEITTDRRIYIKVAEAKDIKPMDIRGSADCYAVVIIDGEKKARTPTIFRDLNPTWLQEYTLCVDLRLYLRFRDVPSGDSEVQVSVWHHDFLRDECIGEVTVAVPSLRDFDNRVTEQWVPLLPSGGSSINLKKEVSGNAGIHLNFLYEPKRSKISVKANNLSYLASSDSIGKAHMSLTDICILQNLFQGQGVQTKDTNTKGVQSFVELISQKTSNPVWNETFEYYLPRYIDTRSSDMNDVASLGDVSVSVWDNGLSKNTYLGGIRIPLSEVLLDLCYHSSYENWFKLFQKPVNLKKDIGSIRLKIQYMEETILPIDAYTEFIKLLLTDDYELLLSLIQASNSSEEVAFSVIKFLYCMQLNKDPSDPKRYALDYLRKVIKREIENTPDANVLFRANSVTSKSVDCFMKLIGLPYLEMVLGNLVRTVYSIAAKTSFEMDPTRVEKKQELKKNSENLLNFMSKLCETIFGSLLFFPSEFQEIFFTLKNETAKRFLESPESPLRAVSGFLFLRFEISFATLIQRFFCAALVSPRQFKLAPEHPKDAIARNLTLISKTLMTLANFVEFGQKEPFMIDLNKFIAENSNGMRNFLNDISSPPKQYNPIDPSVLDLQLNKTVASLVHHVTFHLEKIQQQGNVKVVRKSTVLILQAELMDGVSEQLKKLETLIIKLESKQTKRSK